MLARAVGDSIGMKAASLTVANLESFALPASEFELLQQRALDASPSANRLEVALANPTRKATLIEAGQKARITNEPATPAAFRIKKEARVYGSQRRRSHAS
jgi:hypothetical protein